MGTLIGSGTDRVLSEVVDNFREIETNALAAQAGAELAAAAAEALTKLVPDTTAGLAATSGSGGTNRYFAVPGTGNTFASVYRNDAGAATLLPVTIPSGAAIAPILAITQGAPSPLTSGTLLGATVWGLSLQPVTIEGWLSVSSIYGAAAGTVGVAVLRKVGGNYYTVQTSPLISVGSGEQPLALLPMRVSPGDYVAFRHTGGLHYTTGAGKPGLSYFTYHLPTRDSSGEAPTSTIATGEIRANWTVTGLTSGDAAEALRRLDQDDNPTVAIGPSPASKTAWANTTHYAGNVEPLPHDGVVNMGIFYLNDAGTATPALLRKLASGNWITVMQGAPQTVTAGGLVTLTGLGLVGKAGDVPVLKHTGGFHYEASPAGLSVPYFNTLPVTSSPGTAQTSQLLNCRLQAQWIVSPLPRGLIDKLDKRVSVLEGATAWAGKKMAGLGTSITAGDPWPGMIAADLGMTYTDCGVGGGLVTRWNPGSGLVGGQIYDAVATLPTDAALVTLEGCVHDWWNSAPLGVYTDKTQGTFYGALWATYTAIRARCATALIVVLADWNTSSNSDLTQESQDVNGAGLSPWHYQEAMRISAMMAGLPFFPMWDNGMGFFTPTGYYIDHIHPTTGAGNTRNFNNLKPRFRALQPY